MRVSLFFIFSFLWLGVSLGKSQTQEEFVAKYAEVFTQQRDTSKARQVAMEAYQMVEENEALQIIQNYYILVSMFTAGVPDEEMAALCQKKANALLEFNLTPSLEKPESYDNPETEWVYKYQLELYKKKESSFGRKALRFLESYDTLKTYNNYVTVATFFESNGDFKKAEELYQKAFDAIDPKNNEFIGLFSPMLFYLKSGQFEKVEELAELNEQFLQNADEYTRAAYTSSKDQIELQYYHHVGDYFNYINAAERYYDQQIINIKENNPSTGDIYVSSYEQAKHTAKALGYESIGDWENALTHWQQAEEYSIDYHQKLRKTYPNYPNYYIPILPLYQAKRGILKDYHSITEQLDDYYSTFKQLDYANLSSPEMLFSKAQQYAFYKDARYLTLFEDYFEVDNTNFTLATLPLSSYAYFQMRDGQYNEALKSYRQLFKQNLDWINDIIFTFGEKSFVTYYNSKLAQGYANFHSFVKLAAEDERPDLKELTSQAYNNLLLTKSVAFKGIRKRKRAFLSASSPEVIELYNRWINKKQELIRLYQMEQSTQQELNSALQSKEEKLVYVVNREKVDSLQREVDYLENRLATESKSFQQTLMLQTPDWKSVRAQLKPGEAAVEIARFTWRNQVFYSDTSFYAAYVIKEDSSYPEVVYLPELADELDTKYYKGYKNAIRLKVEDDTSYDVYWRPIRDQLQGIDNVYFSPDGVYHLINLPTLKNSETGMFLLDEIGIQYVTNTASIEQNSKNQRISEAVLIGRPKYSLSDISTVEKMASRSFSRNFQNASISDLPGTEVEVKAIREQLETFSIQVRQYLGASAKEEVLHNLESPEILHIATHGFWSKSENATATYRLFNAMTNSGLLLAGVADYYSSKEFKDAYDGILTAYEAQGLDMEGTQLVILSACETGLGDFDAGEGVYGLQRAFRAAGARSIMTSLWKVDDEGTKDFMISFYRHLLASGDKWIAYNTAQQEIKSKYTDPFYWGAFVLIGE